MEHFFKLSGDMVCITTMDGYFKQLNHTWEATLGYLPEELMRVKYLEFVHPDDRAATLEAMAKLNTKQNITRFVNRYKHKNGSYRWLEWCATPSGDFIYAMARDVTDRMKLETALHEREQMLQTILDTIPESVFFLDADLRIVLANKTLAERFNKTKEQLKRLRATDDLLSSEEAERRNNYFKLVMDTGKPVSFEDARMGRVMKSYISPVIDDNGKVTHFAVFDNDITEYRRREAGLRALVDVLHQSHAELKEAMDKVKKMSVLLPVCAWCKRIRNDNGEWDPLEVFLHEHFESTFTHCICPDCKEKHFGPDSKDE